MICFFPLKELKGRAINTEPESVYGPEALALPTVKKRRRHFHQERTALFNDPRSFFPLNSPVGGSEIPFRYFLDIYGWNLGRKLNSTDNRPGEEKTMTRLRQENGKPVCNGTSHHHFPMTPGQARAFRQNLDDAY
jgi:hypothetical protein